MSGQLALFGIRNAADVSCASIVSSACVATNSIRHPDELFSSNLVKFRSQTLEGPFSAASTPIFATNYELFIFEIFKLLKDVLGEKKEKKKKRKKRKQKEGSPGVRSHIPNRSPEN